MFILSSSDVLFRLLRIAIGGEVNSPANMLPLGIDWQTVYALSRKQGVAALAIDGMRHVYEFIDKNPEAEVADGLLELDSSQYKKMKIQWYGMSMKSEVDNMLHNRRAAELTRLFAEAGYRTCILKGQGNALLYPNPASRQCGDIDIWVEGGRKRVLEFLRSKYEIGRPTYHHVDAKIFHDVSVEVHYLPAWLYNPIYNRRLQQFFDHCLNQVPGSENSQILMTELGFARPLCEFNLVFSAVHIYKHVFLHELTLKQMVDYYFILQASSMQDRENAYKVLKSIGLGKFSAWLMGKLEQMFELPKTLFLCKPSYGTSRRPLGEALCFFPWRIWHWLVRKSF